MTVLSSQDIISQVHQDHLRIKPFERDQVQPASYDVRLGDTFRVFNRANHTHIDTRAIPANLTKHHYVGPNSIDPIEFFVVHPNELVLAATLEFFEFPANIVGRLEGKSSLGRLGLLIHSTAGFFDPGFKGTGTLELSNVSGLPIKIYPGDLIGQMSFQFMASEPQHLYGSPELRSRYQGQVEPTASRYSGDGSS